MSRFDAARRGRIAIWTGAALAWGTAVTLAGQQPAQADPPGEPPSPSTTEAEVVAPVPTMPESGLVILRFQPAPEEQPEVQTVYVQQAPKPAAQAAPRAAAPAPRPAPAPQPRSSGS